MRALKKWIDVDLVYENKELIIAITHAQQVAL